MIGRLDDVLNALRKGRRKQEVRDPQRYRYRYPYDDLRYGYNHIAVVVVFSYRQLPDGTTESNNFVTCFSALVRPTELGPMSFPLSGLDDLPPEMRETVQRIITSPPVNHFLRVSALWRAPDQKPEPITYVKEIPRLALLLREAA